MSYLTSSGEMNLPAPCIVDNGIVVNRQDIQRLLSDLGHVHYRYSHADALISEGEGHILEVFTDASQATLVTNASLYINVCSFDYLELARSADGETVFKLIQDSQTLCLKPLSNPLKRRGERFIDSATIEAMVAEVLSANIDMRLDSGDTLSF
ncbi:MAG: hypothetical protein VKL39_15655 [Leptolyngbyaceae bacterium]|nr:hypothetical protein [Leptolyngbyaceae bacterium]